MVGQDDLELVGEETHDWKMLRVKLTYFAIFWQYFTANPVAF